MGVAKLTNQNTLVPASSKYAQVELERRYLLQDLPEDLTRAGKHFQITDSYITGTRLRLRKVRDPQTNKWTVEFTQKFAPDKSAPTRFQITSIFLNALEAENLSVFDANEIRKNRYPFEFEGRAFAIDMFLGDLFGLVLAETTFSADDEFAGYPLPKFALAEVTNNPIFSGGQLCQLTFEDIRSEVKRNISSKSSSAK